MSPFRFLSGPLGRVLIFCAALLASGALVAAAAPAAGPEPPFRTDSVLVAFHPQASTAARYNTVAKFNLKAAPAEQNPYFAKLNVPLQPGIAANGPAAAGRVKQLLATLRRDSTVRVAEPNYIRRASAAPNDPRFSSLWGLRNTGQTGGTSGSDVSAVRAWDKSTGSDSVVVAVIDTGVDYNHPDLKDNILKDAEGKVIGYDYANNDSDPMDDNGHGTHVAGTVGARGDNGVGVVGISPRVKIMPLKFLRADGSGTDEDAIKAMDFARQRGAKILNNSWGGSGRNQLMLEAIRRARDAGILFVAAAGNGGWDSIGDNNDTVEQYPANYNQSVDNVIAVAATDHNDRLAGFSNYGAKTVDLSAPGVDILSTEMGGGYQTLSGTSMATPHVSGAAVLILARQPNITVAQLKARLLDTVDPVPGLSNKTRMGGRLNADRAVGASDDTVPPGAPTGLAVTHRADTALRLEWTASGDDGASGTASDYELRYSTSAITAANFAQATLAAGLPRPPASGARQSFLLTGLSANSTYYLALRALDDGLNPSDLALSAPARTLASSPDLAVLSDDGEGAVQFTGQGGWTPSTEDSRSPTRSYTDSPGTSYPDGADLSLTQNASVRLSGFVPSLRFQVRTALEAGFDFLRVEVSTDSGATWRELLSLTGTAGWTQQQLPLAGFFEQDLRVRFRLVSDESITGAGVWVDDIRIGGEQLADLNEALPPAAPDGLTAAASTSRVDLAWRDNSADETGFEVYRQTGSAAWQLHRTVAANARAFVDTSVTAGERYSYRVRAVNAAGASAFSNTAAVTVPTRALEGADDFTATAVTANRIDLVWSYSGSGQTGFKLERKAGAAAFAVVTTLTSSARKYSDTRLAANTRYTYRLRATDGTQESPARETTATTPETVPAAPTSLQAEAVSDRQINLSWLDNSDNETGFKLERRIGSGGWTALRTLAAGVRQFSDTGVQPRTTYRYRVRAGNAAGDSAYSGEAEATTHATIRGKLKVNPSLGHGKVKVRKKRVRSLVISNESPTERLQVTVNQPGGPFLVTLGAGTTIIEPGQNLVVRTRFRPTKRGKAKGQLVLVTSDPSRARVAVELTGKGQ